MVNKPSLKYFPLIRGPSCLSSRLVCGSRRTLDGCQWLDLNPRNAELRIIA
jgi:hypothetical protein